MVVYGIGESRFDEVSGKIAVKKTDFICYLSGSDCSRVETHKRARKLDRRMRDLWVDGH